MWWLLILLLTYHINLHKTIINWTIVNPKNILLIKCLVTKIPTTMFCLISQDKNLVSKIKKDYFIFWFYHIQLSLDNYLSSFYSTRVHQDAWENLFSLITLARVVWLGSLRYLQNQGKFLEVTWPIKNLLLTHLVQSCPKHSP